MRVAASSVAKETIYQVEIRGIRPLLMHNGRLSDPMDEYAKALKASTSKKKKTDDDLIEIGRVEFVGGLYFDEKLGPCMPSDNLQALLERGAMKRKNGPAFKALVEVPEPENGSVGYAVHYKGPRSAKALWDDKQFVLRKPARVNGSRVIRTRARIPVGWSIKFPISVLSGGATEAQVTEALADAGLFIGLGDWRPRYGRFEVVSIS